jgi:serine/threonine protein kinase
LSQRIAKTQHGRGLPWEEIKDKVIQVLQALEYASANGVDHRDLKPANIFLTRDGGAKIIDFGIARLRCDPTEPASVACMKGSWDYLAPEFVHPPTPDFQGDERSDIYSFGVTLYQTLTGQLPFEAVNGDQAAIQFVKRWSAPEGPPEPRFRHSAFRVRPKLAECISRCLQPDRALRFASFAKVLESLAAVAPLKVPASNPAESYECLEFLGAGGFGEVFLARHWHGAAEVAHVAVKRLMQSRTAALHDKATERFEREANLLKQLKHPNLVRYIDFQHVKSLTGPQFFLILEYLPGMPEAGLRSRVIRSHSGLPAAEVHELFARYLAGLEYLHQASIIHRDIKPHNLYAPENQPERAKIFDLGIALDLDSMEKSIGPIPGSWDYMPPEFAFDEMGRGTPQSDLYSLGVTLFQALTGRLPFAEIKSSLEYVQRARKPTPPSFEHRVFQQYPRLQAVLRRTLAPKPEDRYERAPDMAIALREAFASPGIQSVEPPTDPGGGEAFKLVFDRISTAVAQKDYLGAQRLCEGVLQEHPGHAEALDWQAILRVLPTVELARQNGQPEVVEKLLGELRQRHPSHPLLRTPDSDRISGMQIAIRNQNWSAVAELVAQAASIQPPIPPENRKPMLQTAILAVEAALRGDAWASALRLCDAILEFDADHGPAQSLRGLVVALESSTAFATMSDWSRAVRELENARHTHPKNTVLLNKLAAAHQELEAQNIRLKVGLQKAQEVFPFNAAMAIEMVEALLAEAPAHEAAKTLNGLFLECLAIEGAPPDSHSEHAADMVRTLRGSYSPARLEALGLAPMSAHLDVLVGRFSDSGTTVVVVPEPVTTPPVVPPNSPVSVPRRSPPVQGAVPKVPSLENPLPWWKRPLTLRTGLVSAAAALVITALLSWAYLHQSQAAWLNQLRSDFQRLSEPAPDAELSAILSRTQDRQSLLKELQDWWPKHSLASSVKLDSPEDRSYAELLKKALEVPSRGSPAPRASNGLIELIRRRLVEKHQTASQYAALGGAWNQFAASIASPADLRHLLEGLQKDPLASQGLDGFAAAFARATNELATRNAALGGSSDLSKGAYITLSAAGQQAFTWDAAMNERFITPGVLPFDVPNSGSTNVILLDQDLNLSGNGSRVSGSGASSLDSEFKALLIWAGLNNNTDGTVNPPGYRPFHGKRAEKLTALSENDRPDKRQIDDLQRRFQEAGKLNESNRPLFDKLRDWGRR